MVNLKRAYEISEWLVERKYERAVVLYIQCCLDNRIDNAFGIDAVKRLFEVESQRGNPFLARAIVDLTICKMFKPEAAQGYLDSLEKANISVEKYRNELSAHAGSLGIDGHTASSQETDEQMDISHGIDESRTTYLAQSNPPPPSPMRPVTHINNLQTTPTIKQRERLEFGRTLPLTRDASPGCS